MIRISEAELNILNQDFRCFQTRITKGKKQDTAYFVSKMSQFQKRYKKAGLERSFANTLFGFAEKMRKLGVKDFPGIIYSSLVKMPFIKPDVKELYALKGLEYAEENGDRIHIYSRLVDLEKLYKQTGDTQKRTGILFKQEKVLTDICNNFKVTKRSYKTYSRGPNQLKHYDMELAKTRVDVAKVILKTKPKQAKKLLEKARLIFEREKRQKEVDFIDNMLSEISF